MNDDKVITVCVNGVEDIRYLGSLVAKTLLSPLLQQNRPVVMDVFGLSLIGKTSFYNAARETCQRTYEPSEFKQIDFGRKGTYPDEAKGHYSVTPAFGVKPVDKNDRTPKLYYYEHPSIPHINTIGDIGAVFSMPGRKDQYFYMNALGSYIKSCAQQNGTLDSAVGRIVDQMDKAKDEANQLGPKKIRIFPLNDDPRLESLFKATKNAIKKNSFPSCDKN